MIKTLLVLIFLTTSLMASLKVCVSIPPQAFFVKKIAGDKADVTVLIPPGSSPATYTPKPSQLKAIKEASLYFTIGVPFEHHWLKRFTSINPQLKVVDMTAGIHKIPMQHHLEKKEEKAHSDQHMHGREDPHVWLDPDLVAQMAQTIVRTLSKADPKNSQQYATNYQQFLAEIQTVKEKIRHSLASVKQKTFIVFHPSFGYFAKAFGLHQVAIEREGKEPSLAYIKRVIEFAREHRIQTIFVEPQFSQKSARYIAKAIGGKVVNIDPLAYAWDKNLLEVAQSFEKAD